MPLTLCMYMHCRQTKIETKEFCELLYIEAANIQRIYMSNQEVMDGLLRVGPTSGSGPSPEPEDTSDGRGKDLEVSELAMAGWTLHQLIKDHFKELIRCGQGTSQSVFIVCTLSRKKIQRCE